LGKAGVLDSDMPYRQSFVQPAMIPYHTRKNQINSVANHVLQPTIIKVCVAMGSQQVSVHIATNQKTVRPGDSAV